MTFKEQWRSIDTLSNNFNSSKLMLTTLPMIMPVMSFLVVIMVLKFLKTPTRICALIILTTDLFTPMFIEMVLAILTYILTSTQRSTSISVILITHKTKLIVNMTNMIIWKKNMMAIHLLLR